MTNKEINERVAKLCGWERNPNSGMWTHKTKSDPNDPNDYQEDPPNYSEQPYACREFMSQIDEKERDEFCMIVCQLERIHPLFEYEFWWAMINITPLELCEAFLRLKGQWE